MEDLETMTKEEWRPVVGFEDYEVNSFGDVRSLDRIIVRTNGCKYRANGKKIAQYLDKYGYYYVNLYKEGSRYKKLVHRLVAEAFLLNKSKKPCVDHIDTMRTNNVVTNLRWVTYKENSNNDLSRKHYSAVKTEWWKDESNHKWMSESKIGENNPNYGKKYTDEEKNIIAEKQRKTVYQYKLNGDFVRSYKSVKEAAEINGYDSGNISRACRRIYNTYKNSVWTYEKL